MRCYTVTNSSSLLLLPAGLPVQPPLSNPVIEGDGGRMSWTCQSLWSDDHERLGAEDGSTGSLWKGKWMRAELPDTVNPSAPQPGETLLL